MARILPCLLVAIALFTRSIHAKEPINDFCRRWGAQTAKVDGKLFIDGGQVAWNPLSANPANYTNTWLLYSDLNSSSQDVGMPLQYANLTKDGSVPSVSGGILWADEVNKCFYMFGGQYQTNPGDFSFWTYDIPMNRWNQTKYTSNVNSLQRIAFGAGATAPELGYGYYYGGWMNNLTNPQWSGAPAAGNNLIQYDFSKGTLNNNSGPDTIGRAEGQMVYLPASDSGVLVYFGGVEDPSRNGTMVGANMTTIRIFDIASSKWYTQKATGSVPKPRRQFCAGVSYPDDYSSYNIYLYGGYNMEEEVAGYDDVYVLSLPSFQWIKLFPNDNSTGNPAYAHGGCTANVINKNQMIVMGGWFPGSDQCDSPGSQGQHNMNLGYNGPATALWDKYSPSATRYSVPTPILSAIGGGSTGGATSRKPASWDHADLGFYFTRVPTFAARAATRSVPTGTAAPSSGGGSKKTNVGAIAGGVVGGLAVLIVLLSLVLLCLRRHKNSLKKKANMNSSPTPAELHNTPVIHELGSPTTSKFGGSNPPELHQHPAYSEPNSPHSHSRSYSGGYLLGGTPLHPTQSPTVAVSELPADHSIRGSFSPYTDNPPSSQTSPYTAHSDIAITPQLYYPPPANLSPAPIQHQPQVYYPPPPDPTTRSPVIGHQPEYSDHQRYSSPTGTQYSEHTQSQYGGGGGSSTSSPPSTSVTPSHLYAQLVPRYNTDLHPELPQQQHQQQQQRPNSFISQDDDYRSSSLNGSVDSRRRLGRGRFVEVDHM